LTYYLVPAKWALQADRRWAAQLCYPGRTSGGGRFGVGALSHFLKNRVYIGEIFYRGEIHAGEHEPILDRSTFEQVQKKLSANNVERQLKLKGSRSPLVGRIFDDRGNRMLPTHTVKNGVRYRYYVSSAIQQKRDSDVGSVSRVPAPEIENLTIQAVWEFCKTDAAIAETPNGACLTWLTRVVITPTGIKVHVVDPSPPNAEEGLSQGILSRAPTVLTVQWEPSKFVALKGIVHVPSETAPGLKRENRDTILRAIAKSRLWLDELIRGRASVGDIAVREGKIERHIRLLLPLAFVSPGMVRAIANGSAPAHLTVTGLAKRVPLSWN
jgi:hypothetical protein